ncbi:MAG: thioredoxin family protein [Thermodesulfobacteriota bacterium]
MIWKFGALTVLAMSLVCGSALAQDKNEAEKKAALKKLEKAFDASKMTGKAAALDVGPEDPLTVQPGDLVRAEYGLRLEDGLLIRTTRALEAKDSRIPKVAGYQDPMEFSPEEVVAGGQGAVPGLGAAVIGMAKGEKRSITLPPEMAFGPSDTKKTIQLPCEKRMPGKPVLSPQVFVGQLGTFPTVGKEVNLTPYFKSKVVEVADKFVKLESLPKNGEKFQESYGTAQVLVDGEEIIIRLDPRLGADFVVNEKKGKIVSTDGMTFTVDFNSPLAGKPVVLDVEVISLTKASAYRGMEIAWLEDHDQGMEKARQENRPVFLMLYAAWCSWSKKLLNESMEDPRVKMLKDRFVWVRVNSDEQKDIYELYEQKGFPLVVLLNSHGDVIKKIDGYKEGGALAADLRGMLGQKVAQKQ